MRLVPGKDYKSLKQCCGMGRKRTQERFQMENRTATDSMQDINNKRSRKRNTFGRNKNEFSFSYTAFQGLVMV